MFTGDESSATSLRYEAGFELSFFIELYDTLMQFWKPDVVLRPLANRFLRGSIQLVGRSIAFIKDGLEGKLKFGEKSREDESAGNDVTTESKSISAPISSRLCYSWGENITDVAAVSWELAILESRLSHHYVATICNALGQGNNTPSEQNELRDLITQLLGETSGKIQPLVLHAWNEIIVNILIEKCCGVLTAVKGVVATYRMTNRPPPTNASPYVRTILRPLKEFSNEFSLRQPDSIGNDWQISILGTVSNRYGDAIEELISTVKRTEVALQHRRTRRAVSGGISDGEKVKMQLYLDFQAFCEDIKDLGVESSSVSGIDKLKSLAEEGKPPS